MKNKNTKPFHIIKATGHPETFSKNKLYLSLERCGLPQEECFNISNKIAKEVKEGSATKDIYKKTLQLIKQKSRLATVHYSLKKCLFELGPEGHLFETFVAKYFEELGHQIFTRKLIQGKFVKHEVDVIAEKDKKKIYSECKFHNHSGIKNDVKISLYVKARWDDLRNGPFGEDLDSYFVVSNTSFTQDAITYANGTGLNLLGLNMPEENSFFDQIKKLKLYPITSLRKLPKKFGKILMDRDIVLAKEVLLYKSLLYKLGMTNQELGLLEKEINMLTGRESWK